MSRAVEDRRRRGEVGERETEKIREESMLGGITVVL